MIALEQQKLAGCLWQMLTAPFWIGLERTKALDIKPVHVALSKPSIGFAGLFSVLWVCRTLPMSFVLVRMVAFGFRLRLPGRLCSFCRCGKFFFYNDFWTVKAFRGWVLRVSMAKPPLLANRAWRCPEKVTGPDKIIFESVTSVMVMKFRRSSEALEWAMFRSKSLAQNDFDGKAVWILMSDIKPVGGMTIAEAMVGKMVEVFSWFGGSVR